MTEKSNEGLSFVDIGVFEDDIGTGLLAHTALTLAGMLRPDSVTPEQFANLTRPLSQAIVVREGNPDYSKQTQLMRDAMSKLFANLAVAASGGDLNKAKALLGTSLNYTVRLDPSVAEHVKRMQVKISGR